MQDHAAFLARKHDFQADIERLASSDLVRTILETVVLATKMRFAAVARVTQDRWVACHTVDEVNFGISEGDEIDIQSTFCQTVRDTSQNVIFEDVAIDTVYRNNPIAAKFGIVSYASIPIHRSDGSFFGTLCAIDTTPSSIKQPRAIAMLEMFADIIGRSLETEERLEAQEQHVAHEQELSRIQQEFVAVLSHDLRNPLAAVEVGLRNLSKEPQTPKSEQVLSLMRSPVRRMSELVENIMLHARVRFGGGIRAQIVPNAPLQRAIEEVIVEIRAASPQSDILLELSLDQPVSCDVARVAQAVSNLVSNAVSHGAHGAPIEVRGNVVKDDVYITIANSGEIVPEDVRARLFQPFQRGKEENNDGLGLGLYIASSIAAAHKGLVDVSCEDGTTIFTLKLPVDPEGAQSNS